MFNRYIQNSLVYFLVKSKNTLILIMTFHLELSLNFKVIFFYINHIRVY